MYRFAGIIHTRMENSTELNLTSSKCSNESWTALFLTYFALYILGISLTCAMFCARLYVERNMSLRGRFHKPLAKLSCLKQHARTLRSGDNLCSQVLISMVLLCNIVYMILAMARTYHSGTRCFDSVIENPDLVVQLVIVLILILFFAIRFLSSDNTVLFWIKVHTVVDVLTLPNIFIFLSLGQDLVVTESLRFIWLTQLFEVLHFFPFIRSQNAIEAVGIMVRLFALWLGATGFIHMLETMGDPWKDFTNQQNTTFLEYAYFTVVTLSTVGYGDYTAKTDMGRAFMTIFIIGGIAFFAFALPSLVDIVIDYYGQTRWRKFDTTRVPRHILVCGNLTATTVADFLKDFLHKDRNDKKTHVLLLHTDRPDTNLRVVLRSYYTRVQYIMGSVLNEKDLNKAKISECWAVFILAGKHCDSPEREDQENLLRLVSIKSSANNIPVTIQVLLSSSKEKIKYIPYTNNDTVICLSQLKLGILAQSCVCPGLSTLLSNLFKASEVVHEKEGWQKLYSQGASREVYITHFSEAFQGMSFYDAALKCYQSLGLILLAIEDRQAGKFYISPSPSVHSNLILRAANNDCPDSVMLGYFIGEDQVDVDRVSLYRDNDEGDSSTGMHMMRILQDSSRSKRRASIYHRMPTKKEGLIKAHLHTSTGIHESRNKLHLNKPRCIEECHQSKQMLENHILVCVIADNSSPALNFQHFLVPLRKKAIPTDDLMPVTLVSNRKYLEKEWEFINGFPNVTVVWGNPLDWKTLSLAGVERCRACVILTAFKGNKELGAAIMDKGVILCSLMIHNQFKQMENSVEPPLIIADLNDDSNIQFLDFDNKVRQDRRMYLMQPFACGEVLASSFFDSITSSSFHSPGNIFLVEQLISGDSNEQCPTPSSINIVPLSELSLSEPVHTFRQLYTSLLRKHQTVVAISRLLNCPLSCAQPNQQGSLPSQRCIVTAPPPDTVLLSSDNILLLRERVNVGSENIV